MAFPKLNGYYQNIRGGFMVLLFRFLTFFTLLAGASWADWPQVYLKDQCNSSDIGPCDLAVMDWFSTQKTEDWEALLMDLLTDFDQTLSAVNKAQTTTLVGALDTANLAHNLRLVASALVADSALDLTGFLGERSKSIDLAISMYGDSSEVGKLWTLIGLRSIKTPEQIQASASQGLGCDAAVAPLYVDSSLFLSRGNKLVLVSAQAETGAAESHNALGLAHYAKFASNVDVSKVWENYDWWNLPGVTSGQSTNCVDLWSMGSASGANAVLGISSVNGLGTMLKSVHVLRGKAVFLGSDITLVGKAWTTVAQLPLANDEAPQVTSDAAGLNISTGDIRFRMLDGERYEWSDSLRGGASGYHFLTIRKDHGVSPRGAGYAFEWQYNALDTFGIEILKRNSGVHAVRDLRDSAVSAVFWKADTADGIVASGPMAVQLLKENAGTRARVTVPDDFSTGSLVFRYGIDSLLTSASATRDPQDSLKVNILAQPGSTVDFWLLARKAAAKPAAALSLVGTNSDFLQSGLSITHDPLYRNFAFEINVQVKEHSKTRVDISIMDAQGKVIYEFYPQFTDWRGIMHRTMDWRQEHVSSARLFLVVSANGKRISKEFGVLR